jgi:hypothetical protein
VFVIAATPKFAAQAIRKSYEIGWRPMTFLSNDSDLGTSGQCQRRRWRLGPWRGPDMHDGHIIRVDFLPVLRKIHDPRGG